MEDVGYHQRSYLSEFSKRERHLKLADFLLSRFPNLPDYSLLSKPITLGVFIRRLLELVSLCDWHRYLHFDKRELILRNIGDRHLYLHSIHLESESIAAANVAVD